MKAHLVHMHQTQSQKYPGNETPRQGIGNQDQGHPAAHGAFNAQFDEDDAEAEAQDCAP